MQRIDWVMSYELCDDCYIHAAYVNGRLQCNAWPFVGMYALTYFGVMHLHFCLLHCLRVTPRCIRVSMGARHPSLGQNRDSTRILSCMYMQCGTGMVWMNARCDCGTHDSQLSAMHGKSLSTKCVHTYKAVPNHLQVEVTSHRAYVYRTRPTSCHCDMNTIVCAMHEHMHCHEAVQCMSRPWRS